MPLRYLRVPLASEKLRYLGVPLASEKLRIADYNPLLDSWSKGSIHGHRRHCYM